jgi:hypothetical protein
MFVGVVPHSGPGVAGRSRRNGAAKVGAFIMCDPSGAAAKTETAKKSGEAGSDGKGGSGKGGDDNSTPAGIAPDSNDGRV